MTIDNIRKRKQKVIHILTESEPFSQFHGGAISRWVGNTLYHQDRQQLQSVVVCPDADESWKGIDYVKWKSLKKFKHFNKIFYWGKLWPIRVFALLLVFGNLRTIIGQGDIVYIHNRPEYVLAISIISKVWRIKLFIILHLHNSHLMYTPKLCKKMVLKNANKIIFCSSFLMKQIQVENTKDIMSVIPNGADSHLFFPENYSKNFFSMNNYRILFVGRLVPEKGIHVLIKSVKALRDRGWTISLKIVGAKGFGSWSDDPYIDSLKMISSNIDEWVEFAGYKVGVDLAEEYRGATMFCCPSIWDEPFGMVNVEAMASGLPVVASNVGGIPEILQEGGGILVPPNDSVALTAAIELLLKNKNYRDEIARQGHQIFLDQFTWNRVATLYISLLHNFLKLE